MCKFTEKRLRGPGPRLVVSNGIVVVVGADGSRYVLGGGASRPLVRDDGDPRADQPSAWLPPHFPADALPGCGLTIGGSAVGAIQRCGRVIKQAFPPRYRPAAGFDGCSDFDETLAQGAAA